MILKYKALLLDLNLEIQIFCKEKCTYPINYQNKGFYNFPKIVELWEAQIKLFQMFQQHRVEQVKLNHFDIYHYWLHNSRGCHITITYIITRPMIFIDSAGHIVFQRATLAAAAIQNFTAWHEYFASNIRVVLQEKLEILIKYIHMCKKMIKVYFWLFVFDFFFYCGTSPHDVNIDPNIADTTTLLAPVDL